MSASIQSARQRVRVVQAAPPLPVRLAAPLNEDIDEDGVRLWKATQVCFLGGITMLYLYYLVRVPPAAFRLPSRCSTLTAESVDMGSLRVVVPSIFAWLFHTSVGHRYALNDQLGQSNVPITLNW